MSAQHEKSALFAALRALSTGMYVDAAPAGAEASHLAREFVQAGWQGVQLPVAEVEGGVGADIDALLSEARVTQVHWMAVRGGAAIRALESWQAGACRPLLVLVESGPLDQPVIAPPAWRETLTRHGYLAAFGDDDYHYFVRSDQIALLPLLAEHASLAWRTRLQAGRHALALAQREAEQARKALLSAQAKAQAFTARATMLEQEIDAIYASNSWQSTKLLRWGGRLRREPGPALRQLQAVGRARLATILRKLLARLADKLSERPGVRRRIVAFAARHPALARRMKGWLRAGAPLPDTTATALLPAIDDDNMIGPRFKTLLLDELDRAQRRPPGKG